MRKRNAYRRRREPKAHFDELVRMDGSFHRWLEDRFGEGRLMHMVDDASSTALGRDDVGARTWIERYGVPKALYTDWKNV